MTKNTKTCQKRQKKGKTRRERAKYPNLKKNLNLKARRDYIDTHYIDGIKNEEGEYIMRPLTDEEKEFLNQYYKEVVNADRRNSQFYTDDDDWKEIYRENNARNRCLYNQTKKTGKLVVAKNSTFDEKTMKVLEGHDLEHIIIHDRELYKKDEE